jgi:hypothetical protein
MGVGGGYRTARLWAKPSEVAISETLEWAVEVSGSFSFFPYAAVSHVEHGLAVRSSAVFVLGRARSEGGGGYEWVCITLMWCFQKPTRNAENLIA